MQLEADTVVPFPRTLVFTTYRDRLADLVPLLPNVRGIEVRSRNEEGPIVRIVNEWRGGGEIPPAARAFLSESMLSWTDRAVWNADEHTCAWDIETHAFTEAVSCKGMTRLLVDPADANATRLEFRGSLDIDAAKIKGVPRFLASKVSAAVAEVLVSKIRPNLIEVSKGIAAYLKDRG